MYIATNECKEKDSEEDKQINFSLLENSLSDSFDQLRKLRLQNIWSIIEEGEANSFINSFKIPSLPDFSEDEKDALSCEMGDFFEEPEKRPKTSESPIENTDTRSTNFVQSEKYENKNFTNSLEAMDDLSEPNKDDPIIEWLCKEIVELLKRQNMIDNDIFIKPKVGRRRKFKLVKSAEILSLMHKFLYISIKKVVEKVHYEKRKDALLTVTIRKIEKITKHLLRYTTMNKYKDGNVRNYSYSFLEAFMAFNAICPMKSSHLLQNFLEFCILEFPDKKVEGLFHTISKDLEESKDTSNPPFFESYSELQHTIDVQRELMETRDKSTKTAIINRSKKSTVYRSCISIAKDVLTDMMAVDEFCDNPNVIHLHDVFNEVLSSE